MDLEGVEVFVRVVESGSFTDAARQLGLPKSTVSRRISRLEDGLGVRLIQRNTRKLALTGAGMAYFADVAPALATVRDADTRVGEMQSVPKGLVRVTAPAELGSNLAELTCRFLATHPDIQVEVSMTERMVDLIAEGFDVAFRGGRLEDSTLVARPLGRGGSWLVASPSYLDRLGGPESPAELEEYDCLLFRSKEGQSRWSLRGPEDEEVSVQVSGRLSCDEFGFLRAAAEAGQGIACVPWLYVKQGVEDRRLVRVLPDWSQPGGQLHLVYPSAQYLPQRVALFRDFVLEWAKEATWADSA